MIEVFDSSVLCHNLGSRWELKNPRSSPVPAIDDKKLVRRVYVLFNVLTNHIDAFAISHENARCSTTSVEALRIQASNPVRVQVLKCEYSGA